MDSINQVRSQDSLTSINSFQRLDIKSCNNMPNTVSFSSSSVLKERPLNSLNQLENPPVLKKCDPLPDSIEQIYSEAAKVKKSYQKNQKPTKKKNPKK
jgi:hypothetical protein